MNFDHRPVCVLVTGKKGSGKTTYWLGRMSRHRARYRFVFDPMREVSRKLGWPLCIDKRQMTAAVIAGRPVCFDSSPLFPGDRREGLAFFSRFCFNICRELRGVKVFAVDELQSVQAPGPYGVPPGLKEIMDEGRREEIDVFFAAQRPNEVNDDIRGHVTEFVTFKHDDPLPLAWLAARGFDPESVRSLPTPGFYIARSDDGRQTANLRPDDPRKANRAALDQR